MSGKTCLKFKPYLVFSIPLIIIYILFLFPSKNIIFAASLNAYPPIPTGSAYNCSLDFQRPDTGEKCTACLISYRTELRSAYNSAKHNACTDTQIINHWCNGGLGLQAIADCNALKYGTCSQPPDYPCVSPTPAGQPTAEPTPPATVNTSSNPRGCGILFTAGVPSCWCNNGGGQGLCGKLPLDGPGGCRDLCERGVFVGTEGNTLCFMMPDNSECRSNNDGSYRFCLKRCLPASAGFSQTVGCEYPNKTVFGKAQFDASCLLAFNKSSNVSFFQVFDSFLKGLLKISDVKSFISNLVRVPGVQKATCDPTKETCTFD